MIRVEALDTYKKLNVKDEKLNRILEKGEQFEVTEERLNILLGNNSYNEAFVKLVDEDNTTDDIEEVTEEVVQSVAEAIVEQADKENKSVEEVVSEIVEESKQDEEPKAIKEKKNPKDSKK